MAKRKNDEARVNVTLNTDQIVDLSVAVEDFVEGLADAVETFAGSVDDFLTDVADACRQLRRDLPGVPTYAADEEDEFSDCTTFDSDCACNKTDEMIVPGGSPDGRDCYAGIRNCNCRHSTKIYLAEDHD